MPSTLRMIFVLLGVVLLGFGLFFVANREAPRPVQDVSAAPKADPQEAAIRTARAKAFTASKEFGKELKETLVIAIRDGGPMAGVETCASAAPAVAAKYSSDYLQVGRTAERLRNPANAPDAWEAATLKEFSQELLDGKQPELISAERLTTLHGKPALQVMTPIPAGKPCLTCHGTNVKPDLLAKIRELYPDDHATGFREGELRGAFTTIVALQDEPAAADGS